MITRRDAILDIAGILLTSASFWSYCGGRPMWALAAVFYRVLYTGLPPGYTVAYGLADDALHGTPFGTAAAIYLGLQVMLERYRRFFAVNISWLCWLQFSVVCLGVSLWQGSVTGLMTAAFFPLYAYLAQRTGAA